MDKAVHAAYMRKWRKENPERARAIDRKWRKENPEKVRTSKRKQAAINPNYGHIDPINRAISHRKYKELHLERHRAHKAIDNAIYGGRLIKPSHCENCGVACLTQAHHPDYSKRFEVAWLCIPCHNTIHGKESYQTRLEVGR